MMLVRKGTYERSSTPSCILIKEHVYKASDNHARVDSRQGVESVVQSGEPVVVDVPAIQSKETR